MFVDMVNWLCLPHRKQTHVTHIPFIYSNKTMIFELSLCRQIRRYIYLVQLKLPSPITGLI